MPELDHLPFPSDCLPRLMTLKEEESLLGWLQDHYGVDFSDASGMLMASHITVYARCNRMIGGYIGTVIILNNGDHFYVFSWKDNGVKLEKEYQPI